MNRSEHQMSSVLDEMQALLARLAGLQGHAVPAHRFADIEGEFETGAQELAAPALFGLATRLWLSRFPLADTTELPHDGVVRGDLPLIWCSADGRRALLLRGQNAAGAFSGTDAAGQSCLLDAQQARAGRFLRLTVSASQPGEAGQEQRSAADWFAMTIRSHRRVFLEAVLATFMISTISLAAAMYSMQVYDRVVPTKGYSTLWVLTVGALVAIVLELVMKQVRAHMVDRACKVIDQELSSVFFGKALDIRLDARPHTIGTFASQIRQFESVRNFMTSSTLFVLADVPFALFFLGVIAFIAGPVALVVLIMLPVALLAGLAFSGPIERLTAEHMSESNRKNGLLIEAIDGIESVKAAAAEWKLLEHWRALTAKIAGSELALRALSTLSGNLAQSVQQLAYVALVSAGAYAIAGGHLTMGGLIACTIISGRALAPLGQISSLIVQWKHAKMALKSLDAIMAMPGDREPGQRLVVPESCQGRIALQGVAFGYAQDRMALEVAQLDVQPGERIAVLGPVGSGKSTLIKLLSGLYRPGAGSIRLDGVELAQLAPEFVREHIGYLPQDVRLFNGTLRENLILGLPAPGDQEILRAARQTGLDQVIQAHPKGLELEIAEGGRGLSGGQRQLVGLTRMLLARPRVLLLDEPTASMDARLEARVMRTLFEEAAPDAVVIAVTHKPAMLSHVNRIIVVDSGRIVLDGPRDVVLDRLRQPAPQSSGSVTPSTTQPPAFQE